MLTIQQAGMEILGNSPRPFYFFCGPEYGIKKKYLRHLKELYGSQIEVDSLKDLCKSFERKSLVTPKSELYVSRYDSDFLKSLDAMQAEKFSKYSINGCLICIYDEEKAFSKLDKFFPDNCVRFDGVSPQHIVKYLASDYPNIDSRYFSILCSLCDNYGRVDLACSQLSYISSKLHSIEDSEIVSMLGLSKKSTEDQLLVAASARSFHSVMSIVDSFEGDLNYLVNCLCHVSLELDKVMDGKAKDSQISKYVGRWTREDVYNFYEQAYTQTFKLRTYSFYDVYECLVFLAGLLAFKRIPSVEQVAWR